MIETVYADRTALTALAGDMSNDGSANRTSPAGMEWALIVAHFEAALKLPATVAGVPVWRIVLLTALERRADENLPDAYRCLLAQVCCL